MSLASDLESALREFAAAGPAELRDNGTRVAPLSTLSWEVRGNSEKPLLHLWSENHNLTRRVLAITDHSEQRLALAVECFGRSKPDRLECLRTEFEPSQVVLSRVAFAQQIARICANSFPDDQLESLSTSADLEHSISGSYVHGVLRYRKVERALFAVPATPGAEEPARCLTFALLWLDRLQSRSSGKAAAGLRLLLPARAAAPIAHLLAALRPDLCVELYERDEVLETLKRVEPSEVANFTSTIVPSREAQALVARATETLGTLLPARRDALSFHPNVANKEVVVRFRGLSFLRWSESEMFFGAREQRTKLQPDNTKALRNLIGQLEKYRHPEAPDVRHAMYRAQPERWLEFLVRQDVSRIEPELDPRHAYAQVTAAAGGEHGILDVLCVTATGRLAILELKANEDPVFLLQAAKYWLRINAHLEQGDFPRYGYFPGTPLQKSPPTVFLVAPALRFHPATGALLRFLNPRIEVIRVGLAENWRRGLRVILRQ